MKKTSYYSVDRVLELCQSEKKAISWDIPLIYYDGTGNVEIHRIVVSNPYYKNEKMSDSNARKVIEVILKLTT